MQRQKLLDETNVPAESTQFMHDSSNVNMFQVRSNQ